MRKNYKKSFFALVFVLAFFVPFYAEGEKYTLSADEAVEIALKNNVSVKNSKISLEAAQRAKNHSWNSVSPTFSLGASGSVPVDGLTGGDQTSNYSADFGISATVSLKFTAKLYTAMEEAKLSYEQSKISFDDVLRKIELSVRTAYYELIYNREYIELQEENLKIAKTQYENNLAKYNSGRLSEVDALSAEVNYKSKIPVVESARTTFKNAMDSFKQAVGLMIDDEIELSGSLEDFLFLDEIKVDTKTLTSSGVRQLEIQLKEAENSVLEKKFSAFAPSLDASFKWGDEKWYAGYDGTAPEAKKSASLTLIASIPLDGILPWSVKNDAVDSDLDAVKKAELDLDDGRKTFLRTVNSYLRSIAQSQEAVRYKQANVELARRTYEMTFESYNRGTKDLLTLQSANNTLLSAQVTLNSEILTLAENILSFEQAAGLEFGSLMSGSGN